MPLNDIISRFGAGVPREGDFGHELASLVMEELAHCEESEQQAVLFADARKVSDELLAQYLRLDQEDKGKMAAAYASEKCFGKLHMRAQKALASSLGANNLDLLMKISNYSKIVPILERYLHFVEENGWRGIRRSSLTYYLLNHDDNGKNVGGGQRSQVYLCYEYDFKNCGRNRGKNAKSVFESSTWGVPVELRQRVRDAMSLLPVRIRILEDYVKFVEENDNITPGTARLGFYLMCRDINGRKLKRRDKKSLAAFYHHDFRHGKTFKRYSPNATFESMTFGVSDELKQRVRGAVSLLHVRERILENYVRFVENIKSIALSKSSLTYFMHNYNLKGERVDSISDSLYIFYSYYFKKPRRLKKGENVNLLDSLTFGVSEDLKQRVRDAMSLVPVRKRILQHYVRWYEEMRDPSVKNPGLAHYLLNYSLQGEKVPFGNKDSLHSFYLHDSKRGKQAERINARSLFESMTYGIDDPELVEKVMRYSGVAA